MPTVAQVVRAGQRRCELAMFVWQSANIEVLREGSNEASTN